LFKDRNFTLAAIAMTTVGFGVTSMAFPIMLWAQTVLGCSPTQAALLLAPMAMLSGVLAPFVGRLVDHGDPRILAGIDRKSTRLNSSHVSISYAVFCLKK